MPGTTHFPTPGPLTIGSQNHPRKGILKCMEAHPAAAEQVTTTTGTFSHWAVTDTPTTVALIFAVAGAIFIGIYLLRRLRGDKTSGK